MNKNIEAIESENEEIENIVNVEREVIPGLEDLNDASEVDLNNMVKDTDNIYQSLVILSKRANQLSDSLKEELLTKLEQFRSENDDPLEERFENREQIEISSYYERKFKPTLMSIKEFTGDKVYFKIPEKDVDSEIIAEK